MKNLTPSRPFDIWSLAAAATVTLFLAVSFFQIRTYSQSIDEPALMMRGRLSWKIAGHALRLSAPLSDMDEDFMSTQWHPPLFGMVNVLVAKVALRVGLDRVSSAHVLGLVLASAGLWCLFLLTRRLFDGPTGLLAVLFMIAFPRFIAHAHYNPKDLPVMSCSIFAIYFFLRMLEERSLRSLWAAGISLGLASAMGLNGLLLIPVCALGALAALKFEGRRLAILTGAVAAISLGVFWLAWPAMWSDPALVFRSVRHFSNDDWWNNWSVLYFGLRYWTLHLPWHYTPMHVLMATPLPTLLAALAGLFFVRGRLRPHSSPGLVILAGWFFLPILIRSHAGVVRYDEMRHVFMSIPPMMIMAAVGARAALDRLEDALPSRYFWMPPVLAAFLFFYLGSEVICMHPFEGSYYNEPARILSGGHLERYFPLGTWGSTGRQAVDWVNQHAEKRSRVCLDVQGRLDDYDLREDLQIDCSTRGDYVLFPSVSEDRMKEFAGQDPYAVMSRLGSDILYVYRRSPGTALAAKRPAGQEQPA